MKVHGGRAMLNLSGFHETGAVVAEVEDTSGWKPGCDRDGDAIKPNTRYFAEPNATLAISNCDRSISFELDWDSKGGRKNSLHKIDTLIAVLQDFRDGVVVEQERYVARKRGKA